MSDNPPEGEHDRTTRVPRPSQATPPPAPPYGPPSSYPPPPNPSPYGTPPHGAPQYGNPQYGEPQHDAPSYGQPPYGQSQSQYGQSQYGQPQYGQSQYGGPPPPPFGAAGPEHGGQYPGPDKRQIRPRLTWVVIAWVIAVLCGVAGVVVFLTGVVSGVNSAAPANAFRSGEAATVALDPADGAAVYIATARNVSYRCTIDGGGKQARLNRSNVSQTVTSEGTTWTHILDIGITEPGSYKIACTADQAADVRFGVGRNLGSLAGSIGGAALVFVLVPAAGLLFAIIVTIVVLVRRKGARNRMATG